MTMKLNFNNFKSYLEQTLDWLPKKITIPEWNLNERYQTEPLEIKLSKNISLLSSLWSWIYIYMYIQFTHRYFRRVYLLHCNKLKTGKINALIFLIFAMDAVHRPTLTYNRLNCIRVFTIQNCTCLNDIDIFKSW